MGRQIVHRVWYDSVCVLNGGLHLSLGHLSPRRLVRLSLY
jgi:hypothetical protein